MNDDKYFQNKLISLRNDANLSQQQIADKLNITRSTISKWENGKQEPSLSDLKIIAQFFKIPISYLLGEENEVEQKIIVIDTCIFIKCPNIIDRLNEKFDKIIIPTIVISELNYQKDKGKSNVQQNAWLAMMSIQEELEKKPSKVIVDDGQYDGKNNDEKIAASAIRYSKESFNNKVYMFSNDVYFKFIVSKYPNIEAVTPIEYEEKFPDQTDYNIYLTQEFFCAVNTKDIDKIRSMIKNDIKKIDVNKIDIETGYTPLISAIRNRDYKMINELLNISLLDINGVDNKKYNFTPLLHACQIKDIEVLKLLVKSGADINAFGKGTNIGNTPIMVCAYGKFNEGLKFILDNCSNISFNQQDNNGFTALHKACIKSNIEATKLLIKNVDNQIIDHSGKKAYDYLDPKIIDARIIMNIFKENK